MSTRPDRPEPKPWPMKWIVLCIAVGIAIYTYLTLHYRKPGPEYRPYEDFLNRSNVERLLDAGYRRVDALAERPADPKTAAGNFGQSAKVENVAGGLPGGLAITFVEQPLLPADIAWIVAPGDAQKSMPYSVLFDCALPDDKRELSGAQVFILHNTITIVPQFEYIPDGLRARSADSTVAVTIPAKTLEPGRYIVTLAATKQSKRWILEVK